MDIMISSIKRKLRQSLRTQLKGPDRCINYIKHSSSGRDFNLTEKQLPLLNSQGPKGNFTHNWVYLWQKNQMRQVTEAEEN